MVAVAELHADHTTGGTPHRTKRVVVRGEPDRLALDRHEQQVVGGRGHADPDQLVAVAQVDRDEAAGAVGVVLREPRLLHQPIAGREHQVGVGHVVLQGGNPASYTHLTLPTIYSV